LKIKKFLRNKNYWCAASTHDNEETICGNIHLLIKKKIKNLVTIIIPRHTQRTPEIINALNDLGLKIHCHSSKENIKSDTEIYIVDTYGETNSFFKICNVVFLGGSLINHGGQNPIEAARNSCKIVYGPHIQNFREVYGLLDKNKVSYKVSNSKELIKKVEASEKSKRKKIDELKKNISFLLEEVKKKKPESSKGIFIKKFFINSTMGPGLQVDPTSVM